MPLCLGKTTTQFHLALRNWKWNWAQSPTVVIWHCLRAKRPRSAVWAAAGTRPPTSSGSSTSANSSASTTRPTRPTSARSKRGWPSRRSPTPSTRRITRNCWGVSPSTRPIRLKAGNRPSRSTSTVSPHHPYHFPSHPATGEGGGILGIVINRRHLLFFYRRSGSDSRRDSDGRPRRKYRFRLFALPGGRQPSSDGHLASRGWQFDD